MKNEIKGQSVIKGAIILAAAVFVSRLIGLIYKIPITDILGDEGMAIYMSSYTVYMLLLTFSAVGMPAAISKLVSEKIAQNAYKDAHRIFKVALFYLTLVGITSTVVLWFGAEYISALLKNGDTALAMPLRALAPTLIIVTIVAVIRGYFQGLGNMVPSAISQVVEQLFNAVFSVILAAVFIPSGIVASATGATLGPGIGALASLIFLGSIYFVTYKKIHIHFKNKEEQESVMNNTPQESTIAILKKLIFLVVPILLTSSIFSFISTVDQKMLYSRLPKSVHYLEAHHQLALLPIEELKEYDYTVQMNDQQLTQTVDRLVGQYMGKYNTMINLPLSLILQITTAAMPAIAAATVLGHLEELKKKIYTVLKMGILLAVPSAVGLSVFGEVIIPMLYRKAPDGGELLLFGSMVIVPMAIAQLTGGMLQGMGRQKMPVINAMIACSTKIIVNMILLSIPSLHIYGILLSSILCYVLYAVLNIRALLQVTKQKLNWRELLFKPLVASAIMGVIAYGSYVLLNSLYPKALLWLGVAIGIGAFSYGIAILKLNVITEQDLLTMPGGQTISRVVFRKKGQ